MEKTNLKEMNEEYINNQDSENTLDVKDDNDSYLNMIEKYNLDKDKVIEISNELSVSDRGSLHLYGSDLKNEITAISNDLLDNTNTEQITEVQSVLDSLLEKFDDVDPNKLLPEEKGRIRTFISKMRNTLEKNLGIMETTSAEIDNITKLLEQHKNELIKTANDSDKIYKLSNELTRNLEYYIAAAKYKIEQLNNEELPRLEEEVQKDNKYAVQDIQDIKEYIDALDQKIYDLKMTQAVNTQTGAQYRVTAGLNHSLAQKIESSIVTTVPLWRESLAIATRSLTTRSANVTLEKMQEATNIMIEKNAQNTADNIRNTAKVLNSSDIDIDKLSKGRDQIIKSIKDAQRITNEGKRNKEKNLEKFEKFKHDTLSMIDELEQPLLENNNK